jgi:hypothetical protein
MPGNIKKEYTIAGPKKKYQWKRKKLDNITQNHSKSPHHTPNHPEGFHPHPHHTHPFWVLHKALVSEEGLSCRGFNAGSTVRVLGDVRRAVKRHDGFGRTGVVALGRFLNVRNEKILSCKLHGSLALRALPTLLDSKIRMVRARLLDSARN